MNIDKSIRIFVDFLNSSWIVVSQLLLNRNYTSNESSVNDWLQANWELLVERKILSINEYLEIYGEGSDFYGASSRITDPDALPNFRVIVKPRNSVEIFDLLNNEYFFSQNLSFEKIVGFKNGFYTIEPEFKYVLVIDNDLASERVIALEDIEFELRGL